MRKFLYSPGYGAGWVSWASRNTREQRKFMLEYKPFIDFLEAGGKLPDVLGTGEAKVTPEIQQFMDDWDAAFPDKAGDYPYMGGLGDLTVGVAADHDLVKIEEYDGSESYSIFGDTSEYL